MGDEAERPAITVASIGAPFVESPIVHRSPAKAVAGISRHANTHKRRAGRAMRRESNTSRACACLTQPRRVEIVSTSAAGDSR